MTRGAELIRFNSPRALQTILGALGRAIRV